MFRILRYFSITSFLVISVIAAATVSLVLFYRHLTVTELTELGESRNAALTQAFANSIWPQFATYVTTVSDTEADRLRARPEAAEIRQAIVALMKDLPVLKVKIYNLDGLTVFSTDESEIGVRKATNHGFFMAARSGRIVGGITHRGKFNTFDGVLQDRDVLESYLPVRREGGPVEAVFELYYDVTALVHRVEQVHENLLFGLLAAFGLVYGGLFLIVRRGDTILKKQYAELLRAQESIEAKNEELSREIVERKLAQTAILENEQRIRAIMENVADGLVTVDERGVIDSANPAVERIFGYSATELVGEQVSILMPEPNGGQGNGNLRAFLSGGDGAALGAGPRDVTGRRKDGSTIEVELAVSEMSLDEKRILIGTLRDATARKQGEASLRAAKQDAERANLAKSKFFAVASHDLRQPLHAMALFLPLLAKRMTDPKSQEIVDAIQDSCDAMGGLLDTLLDISKLDAGVVTAQIQPVASGPLIKKLATEFAPQAREKGLALCVVAANLRISTDPALLSRVLRNLLSNAVQHTIRGRILFGVRRRGKCLRFEIWDTGVGIAADHIDDIFQEFYQVGNPERDRARGIGLGLGLAVVKRMSVLLGLQIVARSVPGKGSMFAVEVPISEEEARDEVEDGLAPKLVDGDLAAKAILVIDDEVEVLKGMCMNLEDWGCQVIAAESSEAALAKLAALDRSPDAILADYRLRGEETGIMAIERVRRFVGAPVPAVIVTGDTDPRRMREAAEHGYALVHKPVAPEKLYRILRREMERGRKFRDPASGHLPTGGRASGRERPENRLDATGFAAEPRRST